MVITQRHNLSAQKVKIRTNKYFLNIANENLGAGYKINNMQKRWNENIFSFSFTLKNQLFFSIGVSGRIEVHENSVKLHAQIPSLITTIASESKIRGYLEGRLEFLLKPINPELDPTSSKSSANKINNKHIEFWSGGSNPEQIHIFDSMPEALNHFHRTKPIAYSNNQYRLYKGSTLIKIVRIGDIKNGGEFKKLMK